MQVSEGCGSEGGINGWARKRAISSSLGPHWQLLSRCSTVPASKPAPSPWGCVSVCVSFPPHHTRPLCCILDPRFQAHFFWEAHVCAFSSHVAHPLGRVRRFCLFWRFRKGGKASKRRDFDALSSTSPRPSSAWHPPVAPALLHQIHEVVIQPAARTQDLQGKWREGSQKAGEKLGEGRAGGGGGGGEAPEAPSLPPPDTPMVVQAAARA